jgi:hypothetical protein
MSTFHFTRTTTSTPEQFVAGLTDFGTTDAASKTTLTYDVFVNDPPPQDGVLPNREPKRFPRLIGRPATTTPVR